MKKNTRTSEGNEGNGGRTRGKRRHGGGGQKRGKGEGRGVAHGQVGMQASYRRSSCGGITERAECFAAAAAAAAAAHAQPNLRSRALPPLSSFPPPLVRRSSSSLYDS